MRILLVEDEPKLAAYLKKGLGEQSFIVDIADNGLDGSHLATEGDYDLVVLDVKLPGADGFTVLRAIREHHRTPVLMLTGRGSVEDRVRGLQEGADDYLVKPFAFSELLARVRALLRRSGPASEEGHRLQLADLEVDLLRRKARRCGQSLKLTAQEFSLLTLLLRRQGEIVARTTLAEQIWDMNFDGDTNIVEVAVWRLRAKLDDPFDNKLLHTVRGMGYVMEDRSCD